MEGFWEGVLVGLLIVAIAWLIYLELRVRAITEYFTAKNQGDENEVVEDTVSKLSPDELSALVAKDLGGSSNNVNGSNTKSK